MTNRLKFRAWNLTTKSWQKWKPFECVSDDTIYMIIGNKDTDLVYQQFTGLKDKNGVEIYEGDIVAIEGRVYHHPLCKECGKENSIETGEKEIRNPREVTWDESGYFALGDSYDPIGREMMVNYFIVIGNKYENPELIK